MLQQGLASEPADDQCSRRPSRRDGSPLLGRRTSPCHVQSGAVGLHALDAARRPRWRRARPRWQLHAVSRSQRHVARVGVEDDGPRHTEQHLVVLVRVPTVGDAGAVAPGVWRQALAPQGGLDVVPRPEQGPGRARTSTPRASAGPRAACGHRCPQLRSGAPWACSTAAMHRARTSATSSSVRVRSEAHNRRR